jgi:hypothetical protein
MTWTGSDINTAGLNCILNGNAATSETFGPFYGSTQSFSGDTVNVALYGTTPTTATALTDTLAHNAYNGAGGQWLSANELPTAGGYTQTGTALGTKTETSAGTAICKFTGANVSWTSATFTTYGCLVYDNTVTNKYAYCWNYFGGAQSVAAGTFTVNWNTSGIFAITCS